MLMYVAMQLATDSWCRQFEIRGFIDCRPLITQDFDTVSTPMRRGLFGVETIKSHLANCIRFVQRSCN